MRFGKLGPPAIGALSKALFWLGGFQPIKTGYRRKGILILTSLEDLGKGSLDLSTV